MTTSEAGAVAGGIASVVIYLLPAFNAYSKQHRSRALIAALTVLFGWTVIGWLLCLAWSMGSSLDDERVTTVKDLVACPHCAEMIQKSAKVCRFCKRDIER